MFPNLWLNIVHEREIYALDHWIPGVFKYNEEELLRWLQATARHIEYILDDCRPDVYLDLMSVSLMRELTRRMCSYRGILWIIPLQTRYKNKAVIVDNKKEYIKNYHVRYNKLLNGSSENFEEAKKEIKDFRITKRTAYNLKDIKLNWLKERTIKDELIGFLNLKMFFWLWRIIKFYVNQNEIKNIYRNRDPLDLLLSKLWYQKNRLLCKLNNLPINFFETSTVLEKFRIDLILLKTSIVT